MEEECEDEIQLSCATTTLNNNNSNNNNNENKYKSSNNNKNYGRNHAGFNQTAGEACKAGEKEVCTEVTDSLIIIFILKIIIILIDTYNIIGNPHISSIIVFNGVV